MKRTLMSLAVAGLLSGCSLIPDFQRPEAPLDMAWSASDDGGASAVAAADIGWRQFFRDPALVQLIEQALANNRDLRVATLNVEAYRAQYQIQRSELFPDLGVNVGGTRQRLPGDLSASGQPTISSQYSANIGTSWELDLFGRVRSLNEQALQQYFATEQAQRSAQIALVAAVANAWLSLQANIELLQVATDTAQTYEQSLSLVQRSFDVGVADALTLSQVRSQVQSAKAAQARFARAVEQDRNALSVLVGTSVSQPAPRSLSDDLLLSVPAGLPSQLLQRRPDILQAEYMLKAANANIGAARAAFFPSISLTASAGTASRELSGLFDSGSGAWLFQPQIRLPIFNAGALKASLDYSKVQKDIRIAQYEKTIQSAFQEVADGLSARTTYAQQLDAQRELVASSEDYQGLAQRRFDIGVDSYLTLLDAQRQLFAARQQLVADRLSQLISEVNLYKALGGGWIESSAKSAQ